MTRSKILYIAAALVCLVSGLAMTAYSLGESVFRISQHEQWEWSHDYEAEAAADEAGIWNTNLPIVKIDTLGKEIPGLDMSVYDENGDEIKYMYTVTDEGEPVVKAKIGIIDKKLGCNLITDDFTQESWITLRYRGNSSRHFDKKPFALHLIGTDGSGTPDAEIENKMSLIGMAAHNEWALHGPFLDRTLIRNYLCMNIAGQIMEYAPNVRFCELFVNDSYAGVYLLMETVSRGDGRIEIPSADDTDSVYGSRGMTSYIVRWDRELKGDHELNDFLHYTYSSDISALDVRYPGNGSITPKRLNYVERDMSRIEKRLYSYDLINDADGGNQYVDYNSFAEYLIINEFFRNVDAGRFSTYYYKNVRGRLQACVWDFNNACNNYQDYEFGRSGFDIEDAPLFSALLMDKRFVDIVVRKYRSLRSSMLSYEYISDYIDKTVEWLQPAIDRNYELCGYLFDLDNYNPLTYLTPADRNYTSYDAAIGQLKGYIKNRGEWLDGHITDLYQYCHESRTALELTK